MRAADAVAQLAQDAARPIPVLLPRPSLNERFDAVDVERTLAGAGETDASVAHDNLAVAGNELIEVGDALDLRAAAAAGAACGIRDAPLLRAVGEDGLERRAIKPRDGHPGETLIDRQLVARVYDLGDRCLAAREPRHAPVMRIGGDLDGGRAGHRFTLVALQRGGYCCAETHSRPRA